MSAFDERIKADLTKLRNLESFSGGKVSVLSTSGNPINRILVELRYPTAKTSKYPQDVQSSTTVQIDLQSRYPFVEPKALIKTPIYHPNVYKSGQICFGTKWVPTEGLDLLVKRVIKIITFAPDIVNEKSPANADAKVWYLKKVKESPHIFPTDQANIASEEKKASMSWNNLK